MGPNYVVRVYKNGVQKYPMQIQASSLMAIQLKTSDRYPTVGTSIPQSHLLVQTANNDTWKSLLTDPANHRIVPRGRPHQSKGKPSRFNKTTVTKRRSASRYDLLERGLPLESINIQLPNQSKFGVLLNLKKQFLWIVWYINPFLRRSPHLIWKRSTRPAPFEVVGVFALDSENYTCDAFGQLIFSN